MKGLWVLILFVLVVSCGDQISSEDFSHLNGYWEINKVEFPDGNEKEYTLNTVVDYIKVNKNNGYRKKVVPKFNGTFETSNDAEPFTIIEEKGIIYLKYKNSLSEWKERLLSLSKDAFKVQNEEGITYHFTRFDPIKIE